MRAPEVIRIVIESVLMLAVAIACFYEPVIAEWEQKQGEKLLKAFNKRKEYRK